VPWNRGSVINRSGKPASGPGLDRKNDSDRFQTCPKTQPSASCRAKAIPIPVNQRVLPGLGRPIVSNLQFSFSGYSIYGRIQISYCHVQNISFGTLLYLCVLLAAFMIKISRDELTATSAKCMLVTGSLQECLRGCGV
jgi:hypothetical protein